MNRHSVALLIVTLALVPLFYVSGWLGAIALIAIYTLLTRLANSDFDRLSRSRSRLRADVVHSRRTKPAYHPSYRSDPQRCPVPNRFG